MEKSCRPSPSVHHRPLLRRLDRCDRMIQKESRDPNGGNVYYITMQITFLMRTFRNVERNLHCDVVHITTVWVSSLTLDGNGSFAIKAYCTIAQPTPSASGRGVVHGKVKGAGKQLEVRSQRPDSCETGGKFLTHDDTNASVRLHGIRYISSKARKYKSSKARKVL